MANSPTEVFSHITLEWGSVNSTSQSTPTTENDQGGPSARRKAKRRPIGYDKDTTISIDTSTWIDGLEQFLWGYEMGRHYTDPEAYIDLSPNDPDILDYDPINYWRENTQYGYTVHVDDQIVSVSSFFSIAVGANF